MFIIYGRKGFTKVMGTVGKKFVCQHCNNTSSFEIVRAREWFTLYWIPIIPYSTTYRAECSICRYGYDIDKDRALEIIEEINNPSKEVEPSAE